MNEKLTLADGTELVGHGVETEVRLFLYIYEQTLKGKTVRDSESAEMLDLIFSTISYDFTQIYSYNFGDQKAPTMLLRMTLKNGGAGIASAWAKDEEMYKTTMAKLIETLKKNQ